MIRIGANKAEATVTKVFAAILVLLAGLGLATARAGFRSPEAKALIQAIAVARKIALEPLRNHCGSGVL
jgi:hypothetical protein